MITAALLASTGVAVAQIGANEKISASGVGPVKFGMTLASAAAAGVALAPEPHPPGGSCFYPDMRECPASPSRSAMEKSFAPTW